MFKLSHLLTASFLIGLIADDLSATKTQLLFLQEALAAPAQQFHSFEPNRAAGHAQASLAGSKQGVKAAETIGMHAPETISFWRQRRYMAFISPDIPGEVNYAQAFKNALNAGFTAKEDQYKTLTVAWIVNRLKELQQMAQAGRLSEAQASELYPLVTPALMDEIAAGPLSDESIMAIVAFTLRLDQYLEAYGIIFTDFPRNKIQSRMLIKYPLPKRGIYPARIIFPFYFHLNETVTVADIVKFEGDDTRATPAHVAALERDRRDRLTLQEMKVPYSAAFQTVKVSDLVLSHASRAALSHLRMAEALDFFARRERERQLPPLQLKPLEKVTLGTRFSHISVIGMPGSDYRELAQALANSLSDSAKQIVYKVIDLADIVQKIKKREEPYQQLASLFGPEIPWDADMLPPLTRLVILNAVLQWPPYLEGRFIFSGFPRDLKEFDHLSTPPDVVISVDMKRAERQVSLARFIKSHPWDYEDRFDALTSILQASLDPLIQRVRQHAMLVTVNGWRTEDVEAQPYARIAREWSETIRQLRGLPGNRGLLLKKAQDYFDAGALELALPFALAAFNLRDADVAAYRIITTAISRRLDGQPRDLFPAYDTVLTLEGAIVEGARQALRKHYIQLAETIARQAIELWPGNLVLRNILIRALGFQARNSSKMREALALALALVRGHPANGHALKTLGWTQNVNGLFEEALETVQTILRLDKGSSAALAIQMTALAGLAKAA